jgi:hypothetical protein
MPDLVTTGLGFLTGLAAGFLTGLAAGFLTEGLAAAARPTIRLKVRAENFMLELIDERENVSSAILFCRVQRNLRADIQFDEKKIDI